MLEIFMTKGAIAAGAVGAISLLLAAIGLVPNTTPILTIEDGQIQGRSAYSRSGMEYLEFLGIPYAEPPTGELRFESPIPVKQPWKEVKQVTRYPPYCLQFDALFLGRVLGSEDCLFLNVFTHEKNLGKKMPVLVYIHGGGFVQGTSSMYGPSYFMDEDIVLVTMNYRLGPLGFLSTGNELIRGNMGLKDQNLALKWVQRNIEKFGGDPSKVTLFGESAGAASVHYHMLSPLSQGLFNKAMAQSGSANCPWALTRNPKKNMLEYVKSLDCPTEDMEKLVECLKKMDGKELVKPQISSMNPTNDFLIFAPSVEVVIKEDTFLSEDPQDVMNSGKYSKIPLLTGVTSGEGALRTARLEAMPELIPEIEKDWNKIGHRVLCYDALNENTEALQKIRNKYFGENSFTDNVHEFKKNFTLLSSDNMFFEPTHTAALLRAKQGAPTYLYYYDYDSYSMPDVYSLIRALRADGWMLSELSVLRAIVVDMMKRYYLGGEGPHDFDVTHGNDLFQLWNAEGVSGYIMGKDSEFSRKFVKAIVSYASNEEPLMFDGVTWPPIEAKGAGNILKYMRLNEDPKMMDEPFADRMPLWESIRRKTRTN